MQGASPLASPRLNPGGTGAGGRTTRPAGGLPGWLPVRRALAAPSGGLPSLSPAAPAFSLISFPHPPIPLPGGKGGTKVFFMQGASPLASPGLNPGGAGYPCRCGARGGACLLCRLPTLPLALFLPPSPHPPSRREGGDLRLFYARGFAPCIPAAVPGRHRKSRRWLSFPAAVGNLFGEKQKATGFQSKSQCRFPPGCRGAGGGAPGEIKLKSPPSPPGKGVGGIGGRQAS